MILVAEDQSLLGYRHKVRSITVDAEFDANAFEAVMHLASRDTGGPCDLADG
ncbi:hypothetical protein [Nocardia abscessus]|uniref:hypothetical protein n=1 Tax=Nocardia abscessus TaxID=120957 RepID=UPI002456B31C|nr:hypothetical protein [Nocardia abscessus]